MVATERMTRLHSAAATNVPMVAVPVNAMVGTTAKPVFEMVFKPGDAAVIACTAVAVVIVIDVVFAATNAPAPVKSDWAFTNVMVGGPT